MDLTDQRLEAYRESGDQAVAALAAEVVRLREGIRGHQSNTGHGLCWLNDLELCKLLNAEAAYPHDTLPVREEFFAQCDGYYESRIAGTPYEEPEPQKTVTMARDGEEVK